MLPVFYHNKKAYRNYMKALLQCVVEAGKEAQWLRVCTALAEDPSLLHSTLAEQLTAACDSSSTRFDALF